MQRLPPLPSASKAFFLAGILSVPIPGWADSPELAMREFASGQIKKGVRSIGFGGDGATWGNYALVWKDASSGLLDGGDTQYDNGNDFHFAAAGATSPLLWHNLAIYAIVLKQDARNVNYMTTFPGESAVKSPAMGQGSNDAFFTKMAMPLDYGFSAGILLSHEVSQFSTTSQSDPTKSVHYQTQWRPSGGYGVVWQSPSTDWLVGFRALINRDLEQRTDLNGTESGSARTSEYRMGVSYAIWSDALLDVGRTRLHRENALSQVNTTYYAPNLGFEQGLGSHMAVRFGLDESSPGAGFTYNWASCKLDVAYIHDLAQRRVGDLFGQNSQSLIATLTYRYGAGH